MISEWDKPAKAVFGDRSAGQYVLLRFETDAFSSDPLLAVFTINDFPIYNNYSNTESFSDMSSDQKEKMLDSENHDEELFLLSWTLTLSEHDAKKCSDTVDHHPNILDLAAVADGHLNAYINDWFYGNLMSQPLFPNILYVDYFRSFATRTAIFLNDVYSTLPH